MSSQLFVTIHPMLESRFVNSTNPFRGSVYTFGPYVSGKQDTRDHFDQSMKSGIDITEFVTSLSWNDELEPPYNTAEIEIRLPSNLENYYLSGSKPFKSKDFDNPRALLFHDPKNPHANFFAKQLKTGSWISIGYGLPSRTGLVPSTTFLGKITNINYSVIADNDTGTTVYTSVMLQCQTFVQPLLESQFRVRLTGEDLEVLRTQAQTQAKSGGDLSTSSQTGIYGTSEFVGPLQPNQLMSVNEWVNYVLNPLISLSGGDRSLGYLFSKFAKLFSAQHVPPSIFSGEAPGKTFNGGTRPLSDLFVINYADRYNVGTKWENYQTALGQATNFKALGSAVGKSCIWRWLLDTFAVDDSVIECFPLLVTPAGDTKEERDQSVSRLLKGLVANSSRSNLAQVQFPADRRALIQGHPDGDEEIGEFEQNVDQIKTMGSMFSHTNPLPDIIKPIEYVDAALIRRAAPVEFNEHDNDLLQAAVIRELYLALGVIPTIFYRLKPLAPGMNITSKRMQDLGVGLSPMGIALGANSRFGGMTVQQEEEYYQTASEKVFVNEYESEISSRLTGETQNLANGPERKVYNYAYLDPDYWLGISFNYSEARRINAVYFDNVFTTGNDTLFDLDALSLVPDPIMDAEDVKRDGFRVYEGSFPFLQIPKDDAEGVPLNQGGGQPSNEQFLLLPQAMAERAFMLLGKDNEYSSGVISMVYHENWDITPGIWGIVPLLGTKEVPESEKSIYNETQDRAAAQAKAEQERLAEIRGWKEAYNSEVREGSINPQEQSFQQFLNQMMEDSQDEVVSYGNRGGTLEDDGYFEFYIEAVSREVSVNQETGAVSGMLNITYSRGSIGRKQNYFRYHDFSNLGK